VFRATPTPSREEPDIRQGSMAVLSAFVRAVPLRGDAALRPLADRRRLTAGVGLGDHGPPGTGRRGRLSLEGMFPTVPDARCTPRQAWRTGWRGGQRTGPFATIRIDERWPCWHARGCCGGRGLGVRGPCRVAADTVTVRDSKRFAEPLALPGSCPLHVREQWISRIHTRIS
jgi:hypothetical protein